jgi:hypothetical protein
VTEWLDDDTILYILDMETQSEVHTLNIQTGETYLFFSSSSPILSVDANESYELFAVHTAPSTTEGNLSVVNVTGEIVAEWNFPATQDLVFSWNPYEDRQLVVSSFLEDWSFKGFLLDVSTQSKVEKDFGNPFIQWMDENSVGYINWNQDEPSLTAPLYTVDLFSGKEQLLKNEVIMFASFADVLLTVSSSAKDNHIARYEFAKLSNMEETLGFTAPLLSLYSNYVTPFFEYTTSSNLFYTFLPYESGSLEGYSEAFQFVSFNVSNGEIEVLLEEIENKPMKISPNGVYCLYGYQLEQLIVIPAKEMVDLVDYS